MDTYLSPVDELRKRLPVKDIKQQSQGESPDPQAERIWTAVAQFKDAFVANLHHVSAHAHDPVHLATVSSLTLLGGFLASPLISEARQAGFDRLETNDRLRVLNAVVPPLFDRDENGKLVNPLVALRRNMQSARERRALLVPSSDPEVCGVLLDACHRIDADASIARDAGDEDLASMYDELAQDFLGVGYEEDGGDRHPVMPLLNAVVNAKVYADYLDALVAEIPEEGIPLFRLEQRAAASTVAGYCRETITTLEKKLGGGEVGSS